MPNNNRPVKIRKPKPGSKAEAILAIAATTPHAKSVRIAELVDTTKSNVSHVLARYGIESSKLESFNNHRADLWATVQALDLEVYLSLSPDERKKRILSRGLVDTAIAADKEAMARGQVPDFSKPLVMVVKCDNAQVQVNSLPRQGIEQNDQPIDITVNDK